MSESQTEENKMIEIEFKVVLGAVVLYKRMPFVPRPGDVIQMLDSNYEEKRYVVATGGAEWDLREYPESDNEPSVTVHLVEV